MSPEQLLGDAVTRARPVLARRRPLRDGDRPSALPGRHQRPPRAILTETPPQVSTLCAASPLLDRVTGRCLEKDPDARWQSARDLASALRWAIEGDGYKAAPPERDTTKKPRSRQATAAACLVALLAIAGYLGAGLRSRQPAASEARIMLAVLPFVNDSGEDGQDLSQRRDDR